MNVNTLESIVSPARLHIYRNTQPLKEVELYEQNVMLSGSFYPLLSMLEVALRNALDKRCATHFADPAALFLWFLEKNRILYYADGRKRIADNALVAMTLLIAESKPAEKGIMTQVVANLLTGGGA